MKRFDFIIGYDIASVKRLPKVARVLERVAIRIQYSLFFYPQVSKEELRGLVDALLEVIDEQEDDLRIYQIDTKRSLSLMSGFDLSHAQIFLGGSHEQ